MHGLWRKAEVPGQGSPHHEKAAWRNLPCLDRTQKVSESGLREAPQVPPIPADAVQTLRDRSH